MTEESSFIRTICTYPDEIGPRLIYADWLEENGQWLDPKNCEQRVASIRVDGSLSRLWFMRRLKQSIAGFPKSYRLMPITRFDSFGGAILSRAAAVHVRHGFIE